MSKILFCFALFILLVMLVMLGFFTGFLYAALIESKRPKSIEKTGNRIAKTIGGSYDPCDLSGE